MTASRPSSSRSATVASTPQRVVSAVTILLVTISLAAVARRAYVLAFPLQLRPQLAGSRFAAAASLDAGFAAHRNLTFLHIIAASFFLLLIPFQFVDGIRSKQLAWHRWSGRILIALGAVVGLSALVMSFTMNIGGVSETAATTLFAILFLLFLSLGFWNIRRGRIALHREWMIRTFGVALGVATTRPIIGAFFAATRLSPHEFFGAAFWLGFTTTLLAAEAWVHYIERRQPDRVVR
jgi:uncharacterized membrane protein